MSSYVFDIGEKARKVSRFVGKVRSELQRALVHEKETRKLTQQEIASSIGVNRSVINRQIMGTENLTIRRVAELAWALGWEIEFSLRKPASNDAALISKTMGQNVGGAIVAPKSIGITDEELFNDLMNLSQIQIGVSGKNGNDNFAPVEVAA